MSVVLGIDIGTHCGWAVYIDGKHKASGVYHFGPDGHPGRRWALALDRFITLFEAYQPDAVAYEDVKRHKGTIAAHVYGALKALLMLAAHRCASRAKIIAVGVAEPKQRATGSGRAPKEQMVKAAKAKLGINCVDHNQADALWVCVVGCERVGDRVADRQAPGLF